MDNLKERVQCQECGLYRFCDNPFLMGKGNFIDPKIVFIGEAPGVLENEKGEVFIGRAGKLLDEGIGRNEEHCCVINVLKCTPFSNVLTKKGVRSPKPEEINFCKELLYDQLKEIISKNKDVIIIALGKPAYGSLTGNYDLAITKKAGEIEDFYFKEIDTTIKLVPIPHPAYILRNMGEKMKWLAHFKKIFIMALEEDFKSEGKILSANEFVKLTREVLSNASSIPNMVIDLETTSLKIFEAEILGFGLHFKNFREEEGFYVPLILKDFEEFEVSSKDKDLIIWNLKRLLKVIPIIGHNLKYDISVMMYRNITKFGECRIENDTMIIAQLLYNRTLGSLKLEDLCHKLNGIPIWKVIDDYLLKYRRVKDRHYGNVPTRMLGEYGIKDVIHTRKLYELLMTSFPSQMELISNIFNSATFVFAEAESKGIQIDKDMFVFLEQAYRQMIERFLTKDFPAFSEIQEFIKDFGSFSPSSSEEVCRLMFGEDKRKPKIIDKQYFKNFPRKDEWRSEKTGRLSTAKLIVEDLVAFSKQYKLTETEKDFLNLLQKDRTMRKLYTTYVSPLPNQVDETFLYKPDYNICGAATGRLCFTGNMKVHTLDEGGISFKELYETGGVNKYVWSIDERGNLVPGKIVDVIKHKPTKIIRVHLDNGEVIKCTPDHKFMLKDCSYKEAKDLTEDDSLMEFEYSISGSETFVLDKGVKEVEYHLAYKKFYSEEIPDKHHIHHIDLNHSNNNPENLQCMSKGDHGKLHRLLYNGSEKNLQDLKSHWDDPVKAASHRENMRKASQRPEVREKGIELRKEEWKDPEVREKRLSGFKKLQENKEEYSKFCKDHAKDIWNNADEEKKKKMLNNLGSDKRYYCALKKVLDVGLDLNEENYTKLRKSPRPHFSTCLNKFGSVEGMLKFVENFERGDV